MNVRFFVNYGKGVELSIPKTPFSLTISFMTPFHDLEVRLWNIVGLMFFVKNVMIVGLEVSEERASVIFFNTVISLFWAY